jgi:hypothetical protein
LVSAATDRRTNLKKAVTWRLRQKFVRGPQKKKKSMVSVRSDSIGRPRVSVEESILDGILNDRNGRLR